MTAQTGAVARPRAQLLTCRGVTPVSRAKAAWLMSARARNAANSVCGNGRTGPVYRTEFHMSSMPTYPHASVRRDKRTYRA